MRLHFVVFLLLCFHLPIWAHHSLIAAAPVIEGIVADGDLSDWPAGLQMYPIARARSGSAPESETDLTAWFRVAHDPRWARLFVAIEMVDDSHVLVDTATAWNASDGSEIFVDIEHGDRRSSCIQHAMWGSHHAVFNDRDAIADTSQARFARVYREGRHIFEWVLDLKAMAGSHGTPGAGDMIGFEVTVGDRDADQSFTWLGWGDGGGKLGAPDRRGDLILLPGNGGQHVRGRVTWAGDGLGAPSRRLRISGAGGWVQVGADATGEYEITLPSGEFVVETHDVRIGRAGRRSQRFVVAPGTYVKIPDLVVEPVEDKAALVGELFEHLGPQDPGASVLVAQRGRILHERGYGLADIEHAIPNTPRTRFRLASVSKQFVSLAVMQLVEAGLVDLDVPLITYLPDYPHAEQITTRQLMSHQSGIPNYLSDSEFWAEAAKGRDMAGLLDLFQHKDLAFDPGSQYSYSNSGYVVLAHLLETVSGSSFEEYLQQNIFDPARMDDSGVDQYRKIVPDRAHGYSISDGGFINTWWLDMYLLTGAGNLYSTVRDLLKWDQALYAETILSQQILHKTYEPATLNDGNETAYGLGWRLGEINGLQSIGHSGSINGFTTQIHRFINEGCTVIVLVNNPRLYAGTLAWQISEIYLSDLMTWPTDP